MTEMIHNWMCVCLLPVVTTCFLARRLSIKETFHLQSVACDFSESWMFLRWSSDHGNCGDTTMSMCLHQSVLGPCPVFFVVPCCSQGVTLQVTLQCRPSGGLPGFSLFASDNILGEQQEAAVFSQLWILEAFVFQIHLLNLSKGLIFTESLFSNRQRVCLVVWNDSLHNFKGST